MIRPLFQNILVLVRSGEGDVEAAEYATVMSKLYRAKVHAMYVVDTATIKSLALNKIFIPEESMEYEQNMEDTGIRCLEHVREIGAKKSVSVATVLKKGSVADELGKYIEEHKIDALLVGMGQTPQSEMLERSFYAMLSHIKTSIIMVRSSIIKSIYNMA